MADPAAGLMPLALPDVADDKDGRRSLPATLAPADDGA
jgi:hypothetical protein